ncbi:ABC transporter permease [Solibacillus daqui]|uniref:ABC transporter permease n=1 Tax=Solibacillus daqui TaxID=2912187 RepID=UPI0023663804|nr:ABC transporter permease [Solibacillus daqui]
MLSSLISRNNKVFLRNKMLVFFSLLSVLIAVGLYAIFLQKLQVDSIKQFVPVTKNIEQLVSEWMVAGILTTTAMTSTLAVFGIYIQDLESKRTADFLVTSASRLNIQLSYVFSSLIIGFGMTFIAFICCELFIVAIGGQLLSIVALIKVLSLLVLAVLLSAMINLFIVLFINSETAFSTVNTIIGTLIGFLCAIYVPMGVLPSAVQTVIHFFSVSHIAVLLRQVFMEDSLRTVFAGAVTYEEEYKLNYGVVYEIGDSIFSPISSVLFIVGTIIAIGLFAAIVYKRKYK